MLKFQHLLAMWLAAMGLPPLAVAQQSTLAISGVVGGSCTISGSVSGTFGVPAPTGSTFTDGRCEGRLSGRVFTFMSNNTWSAFANLNVASPNSKGQNNGLYCDGDMVTSKFTINYPQLSQNCSAIGLCATSSAPSIQYAMKSQYVFTFTNAASTAVLSSPTMNEQFPVTVSCSCPAGTVSASGGGKCYPCGDGQVPNGAGNGCQNCPSGQVPNGNNSGCVASPCPVNFADYNNSCYQNCPQQAPLLLNGNYCVAKCPIGQSCAMVMPHALKAPLILPGVLAVPKK